jgi:hypothetical protein
VNWLVLTYRWSGWERTRWVLCFLLTGCAIGAIITATVNYLIP